MRNSSDVHPFYFEFEDRYSLSEWQDWCSQRNHWPILAINLYLMSIYYGQSAMRNRKPIKIKPLLFVWNACLALFSIIGSYRSLTHMNILLPEIGFRNSVCISDPDNVVSFWVYLFTMSKFVELGDTFFLVIRKRNIMFLHWYHHVTVLLYTWFAFTHNASTGKYFIVMNYFVHSLMYTYFALQTIDIKLPKFVSMTITSLQILQMLGGIFILVISIYEKSIGRGCDVHINTIYSGILMYASYFALFVQFFIQAYVKNQSPKSGTACSIEADVRKIRGKSTCDIIDANSNHIKGD